ncbi:LytR/AlgR family response regulator transcription factor [Salegentibacter chungangensis]|uniref:LytR/AlgR family response regulator transcription factor n=1 Tax=Salegentibacter chungangensis TaxID=1335724 RepID=A0ABW3NLM4_9FLAO
MNIVIIEDEIHASDALESIILKFRPDTRILAKPESIEEAISWFKKNDAPDLIFCDIHLSDGSSFEIFKQVEVNTPIIFTTAYNEYAIDAFKLNSIDYLLKPLKNEEVNAAIEKYEGLNQSNLNLELEKLNDLLRQTHQLKTKESKSRFMVKSGKTIKVISSKDTAYFLAEDGVVLLVTFQGKRFVINYTLDQLEEDLDPGSFFRANRQLIVNINTVKEVNPYFKGRLHLVLEPGPEEDQIISSSKASSFKDWLDY